MRLLDRVAQSREPVRVELPTSGLWELPGAASLAGAVAESPIRYVLADPVRDACHQIAARWPELMDPASATLRLPVPAMWIEWDESDSAAGTLRTGLLVRAGDSDRCGTVHTFWDDPRTGAEMAQAHIAFDFDHLISPRQDDCPALARFPAVRALAPHFVISVEPEWMRFFAASGGGQQRLRTAIAECAIQAVPNFTFLVSLLRLLAVRNNVDARPVERRELNRARARRGKPALLDHVEVSLAIGGSGRRGVSHLGARSPCRQHVVRGHLVNRDGTIFWRSPHLRGRTNPNGAPMKRNVRLSIAAGFRPRPAMWPGSIAAD
ncbi:MAG: hypothetical protein JWO25_2578 [Alphaproteobacteria bacterium]|nr:hypothetical protein [Alphaproteobacteria bacterium]